MRATAVATAVTVLLGAPSGCEGGTLVARGRGLRSEMSGVVAAAAVTRCQSRAGGVGGGGVRRRLSGHSGRDGRQELFVAQQSTFGEARHAR